MDPIALSHNGDANSIVESDSHLPNPLSLLSHHDSSRDRVSLESWLESELVNSERWRGGDRRRAVWLSTSQEDTLRVARALFAEHGVEVLQVPPWIEIGTDSSSLLSIERKGLSILALLTERSILNQAPYFSVHQPEKNQINVTQDSNIYLNHSGEVLSTEMSLSIVVRDLLRYQKSEMADRQTLKSGRAVDFNIDPRTFLLDHPKVYAAMERSTPFFNIVSTALNEGLFFICPENRRQKHVYYTGLHSGMPIPPRDSIGKFPRAILHDVIHELMPDPILLNRVETSLERRVYLAHRVIAEVVAVSVEKLWFSELLSEVGAHSEDSAAQLSKYLKYSSCRGHEQAMNLKQLIKANIDLLLKGKSKAFEEILVDSPESHSALLMYQQDMTKFFIADLHWSAKNLVEKVSANGGESTWGSYAVETLGKCGLTRETLPQAVRRLGECNLSTWDKTVDTVFEDLYQNKIEPVISAEHITLEARSLCISRAFVRWTVWQMSLFSRFPDLPETVKAHEKITGILNETRAEFSDDKITAVREIFDEYLEFLRSECHINFDDEMTFREVVPIFKPFYLRFQEYEGLDPNGEAERLINLSPLHSTDSERVDVETITEDIRLRRATEQYASFEELRRDNKEGDDWEIAFRTGDKRYLCAAWHGGYIEPGSDTLAELIAGDRYGFYAFKALHPIVGVDHPLHITSSKFDEPALRNMAQQSDQVIAIHCCTTHPNFEGILVGGGASLEKKNSLVNFLKDQGYNSELDQIFLGTHAKNPCNLGKYPGFQIEIPQTYMDSMMAEPSKLHQLANVLRNFLSFNSSPWN